MNFLLRTTLAASYKFWHVTFLFSFVSRYFLVSLLISSLTHWLSELGDLAVCSLGGDLAVCSLGGSLKSWGARCVLQTLHSLGRSWELGIHSWLCGTVPMVGFMARLCLSFSYPFLCGHFLSHPIWRSHSPSFWISLRGNCCVCLWEEGHLVDSYVTILVSSKSVFFFYLYFILEHSWLTMFC